MEPNSVCNARDFFPPIGGTVDLGRLGVDRTAAVSEFQIDEREDPRSGQIYRRTKVRLHDKLAALRDLARSVGMLRDETTLTIEQRIKAMTPAERVALANELIEKGRQNLPAYEAAVARGEVIEGEAEEVAGGKERPLNGK